MSQKGQFQITGFTEIRSLTGDIGGPVPPTLSNVNSLGSANISVVGNPLTSTLNWYVTGTNDHAMLVGNLAGGISNIALATDGQILLGTTGADPSFGNLGVGNGIAKVEAAGALSIAGIQSTTAQIGVVTLASNAEATTGTDSSKVIVPSSLAAKLGTQTQYSLPIGNGVGLAISWTAVPTNGQILIGSTGASPVLGLPTNGNNISWTGGAGTLKADITGTTEHAVQVGSAANALTSLAVGADGFILVGAAGANPVFADLSVSNGISRTLGAGTLAIAGVTATTAAIGVVTLASDAESIAGTDAAKVIVPTSLKAKLGLQTLHGIAIGASDTVAIAWTAEPANGQILIGSTGNAPTLGLPSNGSNISWTGGAGTLTANLSGTTDHALQIGNAGGSISSLAVGATGETIMGTTGANCGWTGSPTYLGTVTVGSGGVAGNVAVPATASVAVGNYVIGGNVVLHDFGTNIGNIFVGRGAGNYTLTPTSLTRGGSNSALGYLALSALTGTGAAKATRNCGIGYQSLLVCSDGSYNTACGAQSGTSVTTGAQNSFFGQESGNGSLTTGSYNTFIGSATGGSYTGAESSNVLIGQGITGTVGESNVLRIGTATGTGAGQLNSVYIAGVSPYVTVGANTKMVTIDTTTRQLGVTDISGEIYSPTSATTINPMVKSTFYIPSSASLITFTLPAVAAVGDRFAVIGGANTAGYKIVAAAGDYIHGAAQVTTAGGSVTTNGGKTYTSIELVCIVADSRFVVKAWTGSFLFA